MIVIRTTGTDSIQAMRGRASKLRSVIRTSMAAAAHAMAGRIAKTELNETYSPDVFGNARHGREDTTIAVRSGSLSRAVLGGMDEGGEFTAYVGVLKQSPAAKYAGLLEYGGVVTPMRSRYLAIPVGEALKPSGVPRFLSPRDVRGGRFVRTAEGRLLFGRDRRSGRGKKAKMNFETLFVLVRSVRIQPKRWLSRGARAHLDAFVRDVNRDVADGLRDPK